MCFHIAYSMDGPQWEAPNPNYARRTRDSGSCERRSLFWNSVEGHAVGRGSIPRNVFSPSDSTSEADSFSTYDSFMADELSVQCNEGADDAVGMRSNVGEISRAESGKELKVLWGNVRRDNKPFWKAFKKLPFPKVKRYNEKWGSYMLMRMLLNHRTVSQYVVDVKWNESRNRTESEVLAAAVDDLISDFGIDKVKDTQSIECLVRRIEALHVGDQTGNWTVANQDSEKLQEPTDNGYL